MSEQSTTKTVRVTIDGRSIDGHPGRPAVETQWTDFDLVRQLVAHVGLPDVRNPRDIVKVIDHPNGAVAREDDQVALAAQAGHDLADLLQESVRHGGHALVIVQGVDQVFDARAAGMAGLVA